MEERLTGSSSYVDVQIPVGVLRVEPLTPYVFRIRVHKDNNFSEPALIRYGVLRSEWPEVTYTLEREAGTTVVATSEARLVIGESDGTVALSDGNGKKVLRQAAPPVIEPGFSAEFEITADERLFGLGDVNKESVSRRGLRVMMFVQDCVSYVPIPFLMSTRGWGLFVNTTWRHAFDVGSENPCRLRFWAPQGELDYYLILGSSLPDLLDRYTEIVGKPALLPLWAYGLTFVCNTRADARDLLDECLRFRREEFPCDVIGLEPGWMENFYDTSAETDWHPERFHIPYWQKEGKHSGTFISAVERMGFKLSLWLCCEWDVSYYEERLAGAAKAEPAWCEQFRLKDYGEFDDPHMRPTLMDRITKPDEPWFEHLKKFVDQGVAAFKMDGCGIVNMHPDRKWGNGMDDEEFHNLYPLLVNKQMSLGFREHTGRRPMIYTSAGYTSIQKYSATWAGDIGGGADVLISMLNLGLSGHSNTSCDMHVYSKEGIHFGFLQTWSQINSWITWDQPWFLGEKLEPIFRYYARLRYRLMPYIYSMAHVAAKSGMPVMRAMPLMFSDDPEMDAHPLQYMLGDFILTAGYTNYVRLPNGLWIDFWTGKCYRGPQEFKCDIPEDRGGPLFIRGGAVIPNWPDMAYVGQKPLNRLILHVYPGGESTFVLYEDDGISYEYASGSVATTSIRCKMSDKEGLLSIGPRVGSYQGMPETRSFDVYIHCTKMPVHLSVNGEPTGFEWNEGGPLKLTVTEDIERMHACNIRCIWE